MVVVIPAYEPEEAFPSFIKKLKESLLCTIVVVNDGSSEEKNTVFDECRKYAEVLVHPVNKGKGRAMKTAVEFVQKELPDEDGIVFADADGQHKEEDIEKVFCALSKNKGSLVLGVREFKNGVPIKSRMGNLITREVFRLVSGVKLTDTQTGLRALGREHFKLALDISGERYEYEMNMLLYFAREKIPFFEVPIATIYIDEKNSTSHFNAFKDSLRIYGVIFKFAASSLLSALLDYVLFLAFLWLYSKYPLASKYVSLFSNVSARVISSFFNYKLNRRYVFEGALNKKSSAPKYFLLAGFILLLNSALLYVLTDMAAIAAPIAKPIVEILLFLMSFVAQNRFVFSKDSDKL